VTAGPKVETSGIYELATTFTPATPPLTENPLNLLPQDSLVADFNGDGFSDLATVNLESGDVSVLLGNGDGSFSMPNVFAVGTGAGVLVVADFNGDEIVDLATANGGRRFSDLTGSNDVSILFGKGDGTFFGRSVHCGRHCAKRLSGGRLQWRRLR